MRVMEGCRYLGEDFPGEGELCEADVVSREKQLGVVNVLNSPGPGEVVLHQVANSVEHNALVMAVLQEGMSELAISHHLKKKKKKKYRKKYENTKKKRRKREPDLVGSIRIEEEVSCLVGVGEHANGDWETREERRSWPWLS